MKPKLLLALGLAILSMSWSRAQDKQEQTKSFEIYGMIMTDLGYDTKQINPNWFDALRVTKLPTYKDQYGPDGKAFFSVRQTRLGVRSWIPTKDNNEDIKTVFEFDMFGVGVDEGQTTIRLRHAYAEWKGFAVGQTNTPFMDGDIWPNTLEYWGPTGMVFFRNIQIRYAPVRGDNEVFIALERPGASADLGSFEGRIELDSVKGQFVLPDLSAHFKKSGKWGHVQLAGMLRALKWKDMHTTGGYDISGNTTGWGLNLTTVLNIGKSNVFRGGLVYGEGIENYMNDAPVDIGIVRNVGNTQRPVSGKTLPITGIVLFLDHNWSSKVSTAIGYSSTDIQNTDYALPSAYKKGEYAIVNLLVAPFANAMMGGEVQWGKRTNFSDGFSSEDVKIQFSFKYNFSQMFYRSKK